MKWRRPTDFHGTRRYDRDPQVPGIGQFRMTALIVGDWLKRQFEWMLRSSTEPKSARSLLMRGDRGFSVLGAANDGAPPNRNTAPFPLAADDDRGPSPARDR